MNLRNVLLVGIAGMLAVIYWLVLHPSHDTGKRKNQTTESHLPAKKPPNSIIPASSDDIVQPVTPSFKELQPAITRQPAIPQPNTESFADLDKIQLMLRDYRTLMGQNPVGTNPEIMRAVMGENPRQARLGPPEGQGINKKGELVDRWGTPIFFHQLSATIMEIHSAGPDKIMGTADDIVSR